MRELRSPAGCAAVCRNSRQSWPDLVHARHMPQIANTIGVNMARAASGNCRTFGNAAAVNRDGGRTETPEVEPVLKCGRVWTARRRPMRRWATGSNRRVCFKELCSTQCSSPISWMCTIFIEVVQKRLTAFGVLTGALEFRTKFDLLRWNAPPRLPLGDGAPESDVKLDRART